MRQAEILIDTDTQVAGILTENDEGFHFQYNDDYLNKKNSQAVSLTLPLQKESFQADNLFPFFDGLIPEGWLLEIAQKNWKLSSRDRMGLLLATCRDCIGNISVQPF